MPDVKWLAGLSLSLLNCALSSAGFTLQRKAQLLCERDADNETPASYRPLWLVGVFLYIIAAVPDVIAYTLVPQVVCSTVACFRLVVVTVLAHTCLHERVQGRETIGILACTVGTALCLAFGPRPDTDVVATTAGEFYHEEVFVYLVLGISVLLCLLLLEHSDFMGCHFSSKVHYFTLPAATGLAFGLEKVFNTEIGFIAAPRNLPQGFISDPQWTLMSAAIACLGITDFYLNLRGAQRMPVQVFVPISFAISTSLQYFQSIIIFREFDDMSSGNALLSICGALLSLAGALCIQPPRIGLLGRELVDKDDQDTMGNPNGSPDSPYEAIRSD